MCIYQVNIAEKSGSTVNELWSVKTHFLHLVQNNVYSFFCHILMNYYNCQIFAGCNWHDKTRKAPYLLTSSREHAYQNPAENTKKYIKK